MQVFYFVSREILLILQSNLNHHLKWSSTRAHWIHIEIEYITNISSEMNLKIGEYWEIKILLKIRKFTKNCSIKTTFHRKELIIQHKLWFQYFGIVKKNLSALVTQNIKKVFILFLRFILTDFRTRYLGSSILKRLYSISFCILCNNFFTLQLHVSFCVGKT